MTLLPTLTRPAVDQPLRERPQIWRGYSTATTPAVGSGHASLDRLPSGSRRPLGAVSELYPHREVSSELRLLLPALWRMARAGLPPNWLVWPAPQTYDEAQWVAEQTLRADAFGVLLLDPSASRCAAAPTIP